MQGSSGATARVLFAEFNLSLNISNTDVAIASDLEDSTTYGDTGHEFTPTLLNGTISMSLFFSAVAGESDPVLVAALATSNGQPLTFFPTGFDANSKRAALALTRASGYQVGGAVAGLVVSSYNAQSDGGIFGGIVLHLLQAETAGGNTTGIDNTAATANGGAANLHVTAFTGTNIIIKVQDSVDNSVWTDLITFTTVTGVTSQNSTLAVGSTVKRYLRVLWSGTFTSATFCVAFARRP